MVGTAAAEPVAGAPIAPEVRVTVITLGRVKEKWKHRIRAVMLALLLGSLGVSLGACNPRWHHLQKGANEAF